MRQYTYAYKRKGVAGTCYARKTTHGSRRRTSGNGSGLGAEIVARFLAALLFG